MDLTLSLISGKALIIPCTIVCFPHKEELGTDFPAVPLFQWNSPRAQSDKYDYRGLRHALADTREAKGYWG